MKNLNEPIKKISELYKEYSFEDIVNSLFILSLWMPNISAIVKQILLTITLTAFEDKGFNLSNKISSYKDFETFAEKLIAITPNFPMLEDMFPEADWGDIKFFLNGKNYKIFYGCELENTYDFIEAFKVFHCSFEEEYNQIKNCSPTKDLENFLTLQDLIINSISQSTEIPDVDNGYFEIPPENFWLKCINFLEELNLNLLFKKGFLERYSKTISTTNNLNITEENFAESFLAGKLVDYCFIKHSDKYYPVLPRRLTVVLCEYWKNIFENEICQNLQKQDLIYKKIRNAINLYTEKRLPYFVQFNGEIRLITKEKHLQEKVFSFLPYNKKILLLYVLNPFIEIEDETKSLQELAKLYPSIKTSLIEMFKNSGQAIDKKDIEIKLLVISPLDSFEMHFVEMPQNKEIFYFSLMQYLQMIDELEEVQNLFKQLDYSNNPQFFSPYTSILDKAAFFRNNNDGILLTGIEKSFHTVLKTDYGSCSRFNSLKNFWQEFPDINILREPRTWFINKDKNSEKLSLYLKNLIGFLHYIKIRNTDVCVMPLFHNYTREQHKIIRIITEMVEDILHLHKNDIASHKFFISNKKLDIQIVPDSLINENERLYHLKHLLSQDIWTTEISYSDKDTKEIRIAYNDEKFFLALKEVKDRSIEIRMASTILKELNRFENDENLYQIINHIEQTKTNKPRFCFNAIRKETSFPEHFKVILPEQKHFINVQNTMAEYLYNLNVRPDDYNLDEAKYILNSLKEKINEHLDNEIKKYNFTRSISYIIQQLDSLTNSNRKQRNNIQLSVNHDVDYDREKRLIELADEYHYNNVNYRYLIEKFVQIAPAGNKILDEENLKELIALVQWVQNIYRHSDSIHYSIVSIGLKIFENYTIEVITDENITERQKKYSENEARNYLYKNDSDNLKFENHDNFFENLNLALKKNFGFTAQLLIDILSVLSQWSYFNHNVSDAPFYYSTEEEIIDVIVKESETIAQYEKEDIIHALNFLTLKKEDVSKIYSDDFQTKIECNEIPIYEHNKRFARYIIRPLIKMSDEKYLWGPYSAQLSLEVWRQNLSTPRFPFGLPACETKKILQYQKEFREKDLNNKVFKIVKNFTEFAEENLFLHKRDKNSNHPQELGDYDVLCYLNNANIVLNIECKYFLKPYCLKDSKRLIENIFKKDKKTNKSSIDRVLTREKYLIENLEKVFNALKWTFPLEKPQVFSIYVLKDDELFNIVLENSNSIQFLNLTNLNNYIEQILK